MIEKLEIYTDDKGNSIGLTPERLKLNELIEKVNQLDATQAQYIQQKELREKQG